MNETKKPMVRLHDVATNKIIDREMNDLELKDYYKDLEIYKKWQETQADKVAAKQSAQAKLAALGLTEEEVASILG